MIGARALSGSRLKVSQAGAFARLVAATRRRFAPPEESQPIPPHPLAASFTGLVYELLDAHLDTARLVTESAPEESWDAHLDYLQALQRLAREWLANAHNTLLTGRCPDKPRNDQHKTVLVRSHALLGAGPDRAA